MTTNERSAQCVELHDGKVLDVSQIIMLDRVFKNGTSSTLEVMFRASQQYVLELHGTEAELQSDYEVIKRVMLGTEPIPADQCETSDNRWDLSLVLDGVGVLSLKYNTFVSLTMFGYLSMTTKLYKIGERVEVNHPKFVATLVVVEMLTGDELPGMYVVRTDGPFSLRTLTSPKFEGTTVLTQRPQEPTIPHDQPMYGRCFTCGAVVHCKFSDCKVVDDPPLGRVATVACPNKTMLTERTAEGVKAFAAYKECGAIVRMTQTRGAK